MRKIAVANRKDGVGKTTSAVHLAAGLALAGKKALLIDTDAQGHAARLLGLLGGDGLGGGDGRGSAGGASTFTIWHRVSRKSSCRVVRADTDEKRIRARYEELKATERRGEIKLALDMAVVHRDSLQAVRA